MDNTGITAEELQRQIEELERELLEAKLKSQRQKQPQLKTQRVEETVVKQTLEPGDSTSSKNLKTSNANTPLNETSTNPQQQTSPSKSAVSSSRFTSPNKTSAKAVVPPIQRPSNDDPIRARAVQSKDVSWEKPAWAIPTDTLGSDSGILTDPIQNGLKKPSTGGYERKVFEKELVIVPGTFKKPSGTIKVAKEDLRLVWIVVNINGSKVGKLVMHLYGNVPAIVDKFLELKGLEIKRRNSTEFFVDDIEPNFYISSEIPTKKDTDRVHGHVQEGLDILKKMIECDPSSVYTIKQSHIFPVKKTRM